jgi:DNA polymerase III delta subunit
VDIIAASADISLSRQVRQLLIERTGHEPARLQSVIEQCRIGGIKNPSAAQINILCGTTSSAGVPWDLSDHLERGNLQAALDVCSAAVPLATLAYLGNRYQQAMRIFESGANNPEEAAKTLGSKSVYTTELLLALSRRVGRERLEKIILIIAEGDLLAKQHGIDGLRIVIGRIAPLLSVRRAVTR